MREITGKGGRAIAVQGDVAQRSAYQAIRHHRLKGAIYSGLVVLGV